MWGERKRRRRGRRIEDKILLFVLLDGHDHSFRSNKLPPPGSSPSSYLFARYLSAKQTESCIMGTVVRELQVSEAAGTGTTGRERVKNEGGENCVSQPHSTTARERE